MKRYLMILIIVLLAFHTCKSLGTIEVASKAYADSLRQKADEIESKPIVSKEDKSIAKEYRRAANVIEKQGESNSTLQEEVKDLKFYFGKLKGIEWIIYAIIAILFIWFVLRPILARLLNLDASQLFSLLGRKQT